MMAPGVLLESVRDSMHLGTIISWIVCGFLVGLCARMLVPGRQSMSLLMTSILGIVGALLGGILYSLLRGSAVAPFSLSNQNWYGWIIAILGAMLLVWIYPQIYSRRGGG